MLFSTCGRGCNCKRRIKAYEKQREKNGGDSCARLELSKKLGGLSKLLWGGSALLAFEHLWHGEITPYYPLLTAAADSEQTRVMLKIQKKLREKGITVDTENYYCRGEFSALHKGHPNNHDLKAAKKFAAEIMERE